MLISLQTIGWKANESVRGTKFERTPFAWLLSPHAISLSISIHFIIVSSEILFFLCLFVYAGSCWSISMRNVAASAKSSGEAAIQETRRSRNEKKLKKDLGGSLSWRLFTRLLPAGDSLSFWQIRIYSKFCHWISMSCLNRLFLSFIVPLFQNECSCKTFQVKMSWFA